MVDTEVFLPCKGNFSIVDMLNETTTGAMTDDGKVRVKLEAGQSVVLAFDESIVVSQKEVKAENRNVIYLDGIYKISGKKMMEDKTEFEITGKLFDVTSADNYPGFTGIITYETDFELPKADRYVLSLGEVGETAVVYINDEKAAHLICNPYTVDITSFAKSGDNKIKVEVANSMVYSHRDTFSKGIMVPRSGLLGLVKVECFENL